MAIELPKFCEFCGKPLTPGSRFCEECGHAVEVDEVSPPDAPGVPVVVPMPPTDVSSPVFRQEPPPPPVAPPEVAPVPQAHGQSGNAIKAALVVAAVVLLCGVWFFVVPKARQLMSRFTGNQPPAPASQTVKTTASSPPAPTSTESSDATLLGQQLVDQGYAKEKAGNPQGALADYERAWKLTSDGKLLAHIQQLKQTLAGNAASPTVNVKVPQNATQAGDIVHVTMNQDAVENGALVANTFVIQEPTLVKSIVTYHWNGGQGKAPGVIALQHEDGTKYGGWPATGQAGQGGVPNASWIVRPNTVIKPGKYTLLDSHPTSWSKNAGTRGRGMCEIKGKPVSHANGNSGK